MDRLSEEEILNSKLDEERMLEIIEDLLQDPFHYFSKTLHKDTIQIYALSISVLKDLYKAEKEKNKKLEKQIEAKVMNDYISKDKIEKTFDNYSESSLMLNNTFIEFEKDLLGEEHWQY